MKQELIKSDPTLDTKQLSGYLDVVGLGGKLDDSEKRQFFEIAQAFGLNPFKREIYCAKYGEGQYAKLSIIVGYETYIKRAERSGALDGWQVVTEGSVKANDLRAVITIHRNDRKFPFVHEVHYSEYVQKTKEGKVNKFWDEKPFTMIKKVAIAQGFRMCFSDELGGMPYTSDEVETSYELVDDKKTTETKQPEPEVKPKPKFTPEHKNWDAALLKISQGEGSVEELEVKFEISDEHKDILNGR
jgi:phage recombination protein Bet